MGIKNQKQFSLMLLMIITFVLSACSIFREKPPAPTLDPTTAVPVTADQVAQAMQADQFFSDYRGMVLSIQATITSIDQQGNNWIAELKSSEPTKVLCDFGAQEPSIKTGDTVTVLTVAGDAQRGDGSVVLNHCLIK